MDDIPWISLEECYGKFGYRTLKSAHNAISADRFPVDTFKVGGRRVVDKQVINAYFDGHRRRGLEKLEKGNG